MKNNGLKAFVRYNNEGRIIPGTLITQRNKPKDGTWKEIPFTLCCEPYTELRANVSAAPFNNVVVDIYCNVGTGELWNLIGDATSLTIDQIVDLANEKLSFLGHFYKDGTDIVLQLKQSIYDSLGCTETVMEIYSD